MYRGYNIVAFTPSGRKRVQSILIDNLSRFTNIVDKYQIWMNTGDDQAEDKKWLETLPDIYDWIELKYLPRERYVIKPIQLRTGLFYAHNTVDENTIYIRFDDDVVYIDDDFFKNMLDFRIDNPDYFCVMAHIWNNSIISYIQQEKLKNIPNRYGHVEAFCMDPISWGYGKYAVDAHELLIKHIQDNTVNDLFFDRADLTNAARFSISCFCFFGKDFAEFDGIVGLRGDGSIRFDEEIYLTEVHPVMNNRLNTICGTALVSHYSFMRQRPALDKTDILDTYRAIGKGKLSDSYYRLLEGEQPEESGSRTIYPKVTLPHIKQVSGYTSIFAAEKAGYEIVKGYGRADIVFEGTIVKTIIGNTISDADIDRALVAVWNLHKAKQRDHT